MLQFGVLLLILLFDDGCVVNAVMSGER